MKCMTLTAVKASLEFEARPDLQPSAGEVVVSLKRAALNRRDYWITQGLYPGIEPPVVLGSDGAGVVTQCGDDVDPTWQGREVIIDPSIDWGSSQAVQDPGYHVLGLPRDGTFATQVCVNPAQLHDRPQHLNWDEAAALPLAGVTAYRALFSQGGLQQGETVLVTGIGGGVATFLLQFAVAVGAKVWVTSSAAKKIQRAVELGAQGGFDYTRDTWWKDMSKQAGPPDLLIDGAGGPGYGALLSLAAPAGRIVNYGATAGPPDRLDLFKVFWKQLRLQGSTMGSPADFAAMTDLVSKHSIRPAVDAVFPLSDGNEAVARMETSPQFGKYVLAVSE